MPRHLGIRSQLLGLVAAAAVPFLVLIGVALWNQYRAAQTESLERAYSEARVIAAQIDDHLGNLENLALGLSRAVGVGPADTAANDALLIRTEGAAARIHIRHRCRRPRWREHRIGLWGPLQYRRPRLFPAGPRRQAGRDRRSRAQSARWRMGASDRASGHERGRRNSSGPPHRHADREIPGRDSRRTIFRRAAASESSTIKASSSRPFRRCPNWSVAIRRTWTPSFGICTPKRPVKSRLGATVCPDSPATRPRIARRGW